VKRAAPLTEENYLHNVIVRTLDLMEDIYRATLERDTNPYVVHSVKEVEKARKREAELLEEMIQQELDRERI
jgi:hypothetical protein